MLEMSQDENRLSILINQSKIMEYFHIEDRDSSKITWSHAVNSKKKLNDALKSNNMFIEADILFIEEKHVQPIMAHPPDTDSDLNFSEWLRELLQSKKGLKLDFKSSNSVEPCLNILKSLKYQGSKSPSVKIDPISFITNSLKYYPDGILSLGWTTTNNDICRYSWYDVYSAFKIVNTLVHLPNREITFAVRALWSIKSINRLHWLTVHTQASLTVWSHENDHLSSLDSLLIFRKFFPNDKVFYDLPGKQNEFLRFNFDNAQELNNVFTNSKDKFVKELYFSENFNKELWIPKGNVLTSQYGALLISQGSSLTSNSEFKSNDSKNNFELFVKFEIFSIDGFIQTSKDELFNIKNQNYDQVDSKTPINSEDLKPLIKVSLKNLNYQDDFLNEGSIDIFLFSNGLIRVFVSNKQEHETFVEITDNYEFLISYLGVKNLVQIDLNTYDNYLKYNSVQILVKSNKIQTQKLNASFTLMNDSHCIGIDALKISEKFINLPNNY